MLHIILYGKAGCHLCDEAREYLEELVGEAEVDLHEVDIRVDDALFARYRLRIPVIVVNGEERLEGAVSREDVLALAAASS